MTGVIVTGTDTGIGKTVFAAGLTKALGGYYWKPIQAGVDPEGDRDTVARITGLAPDRLLPEAYRLQEPASPHLAARMEGVTIDPARLPLPTVPGPLVIEGAGGVLVPVSEDRLMADLFAAWGRPAILCARTALGTINHSLMSVEALTRRRVPIIGIVFIGDAHAENERIIPKIAGVPHLGRLPWLDPLDARTLAAAMTAIDVAAIRAA